MIITTTDTTTDTAPTLAEERAARRRQRWEETKRLQRANKKRPTLGKGTYVDTRNARVGRQPLFGTPARSRKPARKAREKGK